MKQLIIPIFIPFQGCPERCVYCDQATITGEGEVSSLPDREKIEGEIKKYLSYTKNPREIEIAFYGGTFTALPPAQQENLLQIAIENNIQKPKAIRVSTHPSYISSDIMERLKAFCITTVELGVQSMETIVLKKLRRDYSPETIINAIISLKREGFQVGAQLMVGCPKETKKGFLKGVERLVDAETDFFRLYPLQIFPRTALEAMLRSEKITLPDENESLFILEKTLIYLELCNKPIIRVGLPESGVPSNSRLHNPSLKYQILSSIALKIMQEILKNSKESESLIIRVNKKKLSEYIGHKKENLIAVNRGIEGENISIQCDNRKVFDEIALETRKGAIEFSRKDILTKIYRSYSSW